MSRLDELLLTEGFDPSEKTEMELEADYRFYKSLTVWEDHILEIAEKEVI